MSKQLNGKKMKKLTDDFEALEKDVGALVYFALFLSVLALAYAIYQLYYRNIEELLKVVIPLGALISAVLVAKAAGRLLAHSNIVREVDRRQDIIRITHHLIVVVSDLHNKVEFAVSSFRGGGRPLISLVENAVAIEKQYEVLLDREAYRFLSGESVDLIRSMSGRVFGLAVSAKALAVIHRDKPNTIIPTSEDPARGKIIESLESMMKDLDALEGQIRQLRGGFGSK